MRLFPFDDVVHARTAQHRRPLWQDEPLGCPDFVAQLAVVNSHPSPRGQHTSVFRPD